MKPLVLLTLLPLALCACHSDHAERTDLPKSSPAPSSASRMTPSKLISTSDRTFIDKAAQGGLFEVESSRLALDKNASAQNRGFANMMITDHSKANEALEKLVREKGGRVPTVLDADLQGKLDELRHKEGAAFDRAYHDAQVKAHDDAIALFESAARDCDDAELKAFATKTLPTLRMHRSHLDMDEGGISAGDL